MLASLGGAAAAAALSRASGQQPQSVAQLLEDWSQHEEEFRVSVCQQCPGGCGILARVVDGDLVGIAGNPLHPVNQGGLCMKGLAGTEVLNDPDRIRSPLQRDGQRGGGRWKPIGWDEALERVARQLRDLRRGGEAHTVAVLGGQYRGQVDPLWQRFCNAYGTPNYLRLRCLDFQEGQPGAYYTQGLRSPMVYDLEQSRYILSFGCNLLESWSSTVHQQQTFGRLRDRPDGQGAQVVMVDPRFSVTASKADLWIPIQSGTDAALALGLAYIIIEEGRYDTNFVRDNTFGFEDWQERDGTRHTGFRSLVLEGYPPEKVAAITGVPVELLFRVARDFAANRAAVALGERGPAFRSSDLYTRMAIHSLNALVGTIGRAGGIAVQGSLPLKPWPAFTPDRAAAAGLAQPRIDRPAGREAFFGEHGAHRLPQNALAKTPYGLNALFLYYTNPVFSLPGGDEWTRALASIPFIVSFSPFMDETTQQADLVLPDSTYLERWRDDEITHLAGVTSFSIGAPVVPPLYDTRTTEDVVLDIARKVGEPLASALPWKSHGELLRERAQGLYEAGRGHIVMAPQQEQLEAIQARQGYWQQRYATFDEFWDELLRKGAWWDPNDTYVGPRQLFKTPSGRFEFYSQLLRAELERVARHAAGGHGEPAAAAVGQLAAKLGIQAQGDRLFLPHFEAAPGAEREQDFPYILNTYKLMSLAGGRGANQPRLEQAPAVHLENGWDSWVEVNPKVAADLGIEDGDKAWLQSARGKILVTARIFAGTAPGVLNMPFGWGHGAYGRWASGRGQNPNDVLEPWIDPLRGMPAWTGTRVRLTKA